MKIFVAGASGVVGRCLLPRLVEAGHEVIGMTRKEEQKPLYEIKPDVVIHQLTSLSEGSSAENALIRIEGTRNLVDAAKQAHVHKMIAQSISWAYEPGPTPASEEVALDLSAANPRSITINGVVALEEAVKEIPEYVILRYGTLYGPATWYDKDGATAEKVRKQEVKATDGVSSFVHVQDAANAAFLALEWSTGTYNIVDDEPAKGTEWLPVYAYALHAARPEIQSGSSPWERGASNSKAKKECGWELQYPTWRTGFSESLHQVRR